MQIFKNFQLKNMYEYAKEDSWHRREKQNFQATCENYGFPAETV